MPPCPPISAGHWGKRGMLQKKQQQLATLPASFCPLETFFNFSQFYTQVYVFYPVDTN